MNSYHFELTIEGVDIMADDVFNALFEGGCDDASFGVSMGIQTGDFHREAANFAEAVASAIKDVEEAVPGAQVVGMARLPELAAMQLP